MVHKIDVPLEELEDHIRQKQAEKERLLREIDEARTVIDSVNVDKQTIEDISASMNGAKSECLNNDVCLMTNIEPLN